MKYLVISTADSYFEPITTFLEAEDNNAITKLIKKELRDPSADTPLASGDFETHVIVINLEGEYEVLTETFNYGDDEEEDEEEEEEDEEESED